jgi:hypothetical protein
VREFLGDVDARALTDEEADVNAEEESERDAPAEWEDEPDALVVAPTRLSPPPDVVVAPLVSDDDADEDSDGDAVAVGEVVPDL